MKRRLLIVMSVMAGFGIVSAMRPTPQPIHRSEAWLQDATPREVDGYRAEPGPNGETQTYRMSEATYKLIDAFGIDSLVFTNGKHQLDVCVIASNNRESFHDPMRCFPGQDWTVLGRKTVPVNTTTRGPIPFSLMTARSPQGASALAAFTYKGPSGFVATQDKSYMQWSIDLFMTGQAREGAFYRFVGDETLTQEELLRFVSEFMDAINATSKGVL